MDVGSEEQAGREASVMGVMPRGDDVALRRVAVSHVCSKGLYFEIFDSAMSTI